MICITYQIDATQLFYSTYIIDINVTQRMVGKHWVKRWCMYRWAGKAST